MVKSLELLWGLRQMGSGYLGGVAEVAWSSAVGSDLIPVSGVLGFLVAVPWQ